MKSIKKGAEKLPDTAEKIVEISQIFKCNDGVANITSNHFKTVIGTVGAVGEVVMPYLPLITEVLALTAQIVMAYNNAQYNKKSCAALIQRVQSAEVAVLALNRRKQDNEKKFRQQAYYNNFERFISILKEIGTFIKNFTQLPNYKKFISNHAIMKKFEELINDFDRVVHDLEFTMIIASDEDRRKDVKTLNDDICEMTEFLLKIGEKINRVLDVLKGDEGFPPIKQIPASEIKSISHIHDNKKLFKARYLGCNVACKIINLPDDGKPSGSHRIKARLAILEKLASCEFIINFYGLTKINGIDRMVIGWTEFGSLKKYYENHVIEWPLKIRIATNICRGIIFLHGCDILHHDIRCENILITEYHEPKITNFVYSRVLKDITINIGNIQKIIRWLAPEKIIGIDKNQVEYAPYTIQCEIFSFGMLLWELAFQQFPYKNMDISQIKSHVLNGKREHLDFTLDSPEKDFGEIINSAWQHDPTLRPELNYLFNDLEKIFAKFEPNISGKSLAKRINNNINNSNNDNINNGNDNDILTSVTTKNTITISTALDDSTITSTSNNNAYNTHIDESRKKEFYVIDSDNVSPMLSLKDGLALHKQGQREKAYECFKAHANIGNEMAKFWLANYYWRGIVVEKDLVKAAKLFKETADKGIAKAQLCYTKLLCQSEPFNLEEFLKYLRMAADNDNDVAQFNLGDLYYYGKLGVEIDEKRGLEYLKLAASKGHCEAIDLLKKLNVNNIYQLED